MAASAGPSGREGPHAFVADLDHPVLTPEDHHHLARVVRLRGGDPLTVSDGVGGWRACRFGDDLVIDGAIERVPRPTVAISIAFALVKGQKPEWVTQKLTELGVDVIRPFVAARSVVRWEPTKAEANTGRLRRIAREASMQCRRCWLPVVEPLAPFASIASIPGAVLAERNGPPLALGAGVVAIGPEGGWAPEERSAGLATAGLGGHILRADTAAIAAAALLAAARAGALPITERA